MYDIETELKRVNRQFQSIPIEIEPVDTNFYIFAIRVQTDEGEIRRMLVKDKLYYLLQGFEVKDDRVTIESYRYNRPVYDFYVGVESSKPHVSVSAIVGENGSGKSSLVEYEIRLINNLAAAVFGEYSKEPGWEHLHYVDDINGELLYLYDNVIYKLAVTGRHVMLIAFKNPQKQDDGGWVFSIKEKSGEKLLDIQGKDNDTPFRGFKQRGKDAVKAVLSQFFYTIVLNQSVYAYNTQDFKKECNSNSYEVKVRKCHKTDEKGRVIPYSIEDRCWLNGLFHKNDGYQIPMVLSPYRFEGNFNINRENELAYERLISLLVHSGEKFRVINGHLKLNCFVLKKKQHKYDIHYIHGKLGYNQFNVEDYERMKTAVIETWLSELELKDVVLRTGIHTALAKNYLVYKTLKIASTYDEYDDYRQSFLVDGKPYNDGAFRKLIRRTIANRSHVTNKLYRTFAFLIWDIFDVGGGRIHIRVDEVAKRWASSSPGKMLNKQPGTSSLILQAVIPPPFFDMNIELLELNTDEVVPFETLSSGEKQQAYTISSLLYHLNNLDSVGSDLCTEDRIKYPRVHLILEEVELYFHPQLQKEFVKSLLDGLRQMNFNTIKWIDIRVVTHSPFVLSDIPTENVLALRKKYHDNVEVDCFGANIHEMLRNTFFLNNGTIGDFAFWLIKRISQCLRIHRWMNGAETSPKFFPSIKGEIPDDFVFLEDFKNLMNGDGFNVQAFNEVYGKRKILRLINLIKEPVVAQVLLDDYRRTFPEDKRAFKQSLEKMIQELQHQLDELKQ
jgi:energy-coupling factor transporter ATP-binding protein EcfA2